MNMFRAFMELDEAYNDRQLYIDALRKAGKNYYFNKFTDAQLFRMYQKLNIPKKVRKEPKHDLDLDFEPEKDCKYCECGMQLTDFGQCPVCDFGDAESKSTLTEAEKLKFYNNIDTDILANLSGDLPTDFERSFSTKCSTSATKNALYLVSNGEPVKFVLGTIGKSSVDYNGPITHCWLVYKGKIIQTRNKSVDDLNELFSVDLAPNDIEASKKIIADLVNSINKGTLTDSLLTEWVDASGNKIGVGSTSSQATSTPSRPNGKYVVTIIYDPAAKKLRGRADDGINGPAWVAFPSNLRDYDGQQYEVDQLVWNGKNYRVAGNIVEI